MFYINSLMKWCYKFTRERTGETAHGPAPRHHQPVICDTTSHTPCLRRDASIHPRSTYMNKCSTSRDAEERVRLRAMFHAYRNMFLAAHNFNLPATCVIEYLFTLGTSHYMIHTLYSINETCIGHTFLHSMLCKKPTPGQERSIVRRRQNACEILLKVHCASGFLRVCYRSSVRCAIYMDW